MLPILLMLIIATCCGRSFPTGVSDPLNTNAEEDVLRILGGGASAAQLAGPSSIFSPRLPVEVDNNRLEMMELPRSLWWFSKEMAIPETKKRRNLSSYNLNSFGLRYGK
ncbi:metastasis-suppressor KiSS-1 [Sardina pilchardus]|uniref:metastasis-suppressor KiSS-1 n=1 Tax=Sardina pilchardus TaxID=27697 RepID=UPI002E0D9000